MEGGVRVEECDQSKNKQTNRAVNKILKGRVEAFPLRIQNQGLYATRQKKKIEKNGGLDYEKKSGRVSYDWNSEGWVMSPVQLQKPWG